MSYGTSQALYKTQQIEQAVTTAANFIKLGELERAIGRRYNIWLERAVHALQGLPQKDRRYLPLKPEQLNGEFTPEEKVAMDKFLSLANLVYSQTK